MSEKPMTPAEFSTLAVELGKRFKGTGNRFMVLVFPPGSFDGTAGPYSAGTLSVGTQVEALRRVADSLERNEAELVIARVL